MRDLFWRQRWNSTQHFYLLITDGISIKGNRRFHCGQAKDLHNMVLDNISDGTLAFVKFCSRANPKTLSNQNLHMIDIIPVPEWLKDTIRKTESQDVLH